MTPETLSPLAGRTIYLVTAGCYSDYGIHACFSTRERAEAYLEALIQTGERDAQIEDWVLDEVQAVACRNQYQGLMQLTTGVWEPRTVYVSKVLVPSSRRGSCHWLKSRDKPGYDAVFVTSYVGSEHAQKLGAEARQAWLRGQLPETEHTHLDDPTPDNP
jgi:hypothetical protein